MSTSYNLIIEKLPQSFGQLKFDMFTVAMFILFLRVSQICASPEYLTQVLRPVPLTPLSMLHASI